MFPPGPLALPPLRSAPQLIWAVPGSKSMTNRALVLAALAPGVTRLEGVLHSDDTEHMRRALEALGIGITDAGPTTLIVEGGRSRLRAPKTPLFVGNSGTTVRFLAALACLVPGPVTLQGDTAMTKRPIADLVSGLTQLGVRVDCASGCPPLTVWGSTFTGGRVRMRGDRSSQYFSALLLVSGAAEASLELEVEGELVSRPYLDITRRMLADFGVKSTEIAQGFRIDAGQTYRARSYSIEPDASSASYPLALAAATGGTITVPALGSGALQGDYAFIDVLGALGANIDKHPDRTTVRGSGPLRALDLDMHHISDTVMTLAALAPLCDGVTTIRNVANIRLKETDRLLATVQELERLGQKVTSGADFLSIEPRPITPAIIHCYGDHRMAMSFAVLGATRGGIQIEDPACVSKTYPTFWDDLKRAYQSVGMDVPW